MTDPYTDADLRAEAARQLRTAVHPESLDVLDSMEAHQIPSRGDVQWSGLNDSDFDDAGREVSELVEGAIDQSRWAVDLGVCHLARTTNLAWGHGDNWGVAVQIAHRPRVADELHDALTTAVQKAIAGVLADHNIDVQPCETHDS